MSVLDDIVAERKRQDDQWGGAEHDDALDLDLWMLILTKHVGRLAELNLDQYGKRVVSVRAIYEQTVKVAAITVAMAEALDRAHALASGALPEGNDAFVAADDWERARRELDDPEVECPYCGHARHVEMCEVSFPELSICACPSEKR